MESTRISKRLSQGQNKMADLYLQAKGCVIVVLSDKEVRVLDPDNVMVLEGDNLDNAVEWEIPRRDTTVKVVTNKKSSKWFGK